MEWVAAKEALDAGGAGKVKVVEEYAKKVRYVFFCAKNLIIDLILCSLSYICFLQILWNT